MTRLVRFALVASIAAVCAPICSVAAAEAPKQEHCERAPVVAHVPGRLDPVWVIRCIGADGFSTLNQRPAVEASRNTSFNQPRRPLLHHT